MMAVTNQAHERRFLSHLLAAKREIKWIHDGVSLRRLVPPPHGREAPPMVGGVRPSRCPRAMGKSAGKAEPHDWTNLAFRGRFSSGGDFLSDFENNSQGSAVSHTN